MTISVWPKSATVFLNVGSALAGLLVSATWFTLAGVIPLFRLAAINPNYPVPVSYLWVLFALVALAGMLFGILSSLFFLGLRRLFRHLRWVTRSEPLAAGMAAALTSSLAYLVLFQGEPTISFVAFSGLPTILWGVGLSGAAFWIDHHTLNPDTHS